MKFFDSFWKKSFYTEGRATSFWGAFGKVTLVSFVLSVAYAVYFYATFGMHIPGYIYSYGVQALSGYPADLVITVDHNKMTKNVRGEVLLYPIPEGKIGKVRMEDVLPGYLIAINDSETASLDAYARSNALILLSKDGIVTQGDKELQIIPYKDALHLDDSFVITKDTVVGMVSAVNMYAPSLPGLIFVAIILLFSVFAPIGYLLITLLTALIVMIFSEKLLNKEATYKEAFIYALYALSPVVLVTSLLAVVPLIKYVINVVPFLTTIGVVIFLWYVFKNNKVKVATRRKTQKEVVEVPVESVEEVTPKTKTAKKKTTRKKKEVKE